MFKHSVCGMIEEMKIFDNDCRKKKYKSANYLKNLDKKNLEKNDCQTRLRKYDPRDNKSVNLACEVDSLQGVFRRCHEEMDNYSIAQNGHKSLLSITAKLNDLSKNIEYRPISVRPNHQKEL